MITMSRRDVLNRAAAVPAAFALAGASSACAEQNAADQGAMGQIAVKAPSTPDRSREMAEAATHFLDQLSDRERDRARFDINDRERLRWHWTINTTFPRNGLPLRDLFQPKHDVAYELLSASLSATGIDKARKIMELQREMPFRGADPLLYFVSIFGEPGADIWGWRFEGHHLSHHFLVAGDRLVTTPFFHGAWPTRTSNGFRTMPREEDAARELLLALDGSERERVVFSHDSLRRHETQNLAFVEPLENVGAELQLLGGASVARAQEIVDTYLASLPAEHAGWQRQRIDAAGGLQKVTFGWSGSSEPNQPHYYRLQGPTFLLEFDNSRNGGTHIHSVWRDFDHDFGIGRSSSHG